MASTFESLRRLPRGQFPIGFHTVQIAKIKIKLNLKDNVNWNEHDLTRACVSKLFENGTTYQPSSGRQPRTVLNVRKHFQDTLIPRDATGSFRSAASTTLKSGRAKVLP